jgi:hypothetical protein
MQSFANSKPLDAESITVSGNRLSFIVVLYCLMIALPIQFNAGPVAMNGIRALLFVAFIPLSYRLFSGQVGRLIVTDFMLLAYIAWAVAMLFVNSRAYTISIGGSYLLEVYGSYLLARNYIRTPKQFLAMCRGFILVLIFSLPFAIYETQTGIALIPRFIDGFPGIHSHGDYGGSTFSKRFGLERSQVIFTHPIHYGLFCSSLMSIVLIGFRERIGNLVRYILGGLVFCGVVASVSSGALLPLILQTIMLLWAWVFRSVESRWKIFTIIVIIGYSVVDIISNRSGVEVFLSYAALSPETAYGRIIIFKWGMVNVWANPLFGIGLNDWVRPWWLHSSVDNFWLLVAMRYGLPGFLLLAAAYLFLFWKIMRRNFGSAGVVWRLRRAWVFTQVSLILTLATVDIWDAALSYVFFLFGSAAWMVTWQLETSASEVVANSSGNHSGVRYTRFSGPRSRSTGSLVGRKA